MESGQTVRASPRSPAHGWPKPGSIRGYFTRDLCRARAFLLEQFREQYFERGRACSWQSGHAHLVPPVSSVGAAFDAAAGLAGALATAAGFAAGTPTDRSDGLGSTSWSRFAATEPVSMASSSEGLRRGTNRFGALLAFFARGLFGSKPSGIGGRSAIGGRLLEHSQHCSIPAGRTNAGRCLPHAQCSYSFQYTFVRRDRFLMGVAVLPCWMTNSDQNVYHQVQGKWKACEKIRGCCGVSWNPFVRAWAIRFSGVGV